MRRPWSWLAGTAIVAGVLGSGIERLEWRTDDAADSADGESVAERTAEDRRAFFENDEIIVLLTAQAGSPAVASSQGLRRLRQVHDALRTVPGIESDRVRSLASLLDPRPEMSIVAIPQALDTIPDGDDECRRLVDRLRGNPLVTGLFLSADGRAAALYAPLSGTDARGQVPERVERRLAPLRSAAFDLRVTGPVAVAAARGRIVLADLIRLAAVMTAAVASLYALWLKSIRGAVIALVRIAVVVLCTFGGMGWARIPITVVTPILLIVLIALPATAELRLLNRVRASLASGCDTVEEAMRRAVRDAGRAVVLTSMTTVACFLSFLSAPFAALRWFGVCAAFGILLSLFLSFTMVPAIVQALPRPWREVPDAGGPARKRVLAGGALLLVAVPGLVRLGVRESWAGGLDPASDVMSARRAYDAAFWGAHRFDVVLTSTQSTFFQRAEGIRLVEEVVRVARAAPRVKGVISHVLAHEILAGAYGETGPISRLPPDQVLWYSSLLMKVQTRIDLDHHLRRDGAAARIRLFLKEADRGRTGDVRARLDAAIPGIVDGTGVSYSFSGELPSAEAAQRAIVPTLWRWLGWTAVAAGLVLAFGLRGARRAWIGLAPPLGALAIILGVMRCAAPPLGIAGCALLAVAFAATVDLWLSCLQPVHVRE